MNTALWIVAGLLCVAFLAAGIPKLVGGKAKISANPQMAWSENFSDVAIRGIGLAEVLGALGLILPPVFQLWMPLTAAAALGLAALMAGAVGTHMRRKESFVPALLITALALFVFVGRAFLVQF
ncbi:MAG: DoxX family protein [Actinobacteria bacterium]|nr:DoxX family protein [Actinomycetota bacterium]